MMLPSGSYVRVVARLVLVEVTKLFSTLGTGVFLAVSLVVGVGVGAAAGLGASPDLVHAGAVVVALGAVMNIAMPILGVLVFTSDWQHGDVISLFLGHPRRLRSFVAKLLAVLVSSMTLLAATATIAVAVAALLGVATGRSLTWAGLEQIPWVLASSAVVGAFAGAALGAAFKNAVAAITISFLQLLVLDPALSFMPGEIGPYFMSSSIAAYLAGDGGVVAFLTSALLWLVVPLSVGMARHTLEDVG